MSFKEPSPSPSCFSIPSSVTPTSPFVDDLTSPIHWLIFTYVGDVTLITSIFQLNTFFRNYYISTGKYNKNTKIILENIIGKKIINELTLNNEMNKSSPKELFELVFKDLYKIWKDLYDNGDSQNPDFEFICKKKKVNHHSLVKKTKSLVS